MESVGGGAAGALPSDEEIRNMAGSLAAAVRDDPLAFGILDQMRAEPQIRQQLSRAVEAIHDGRIDELSELQQSALEAIVLLTGRPALFIKTDTFELPTGEWEILAPYRAEISAVAKSVGRIGVSMDYGTPYVGSGFVVAPGLVMTNRHVVEKFVARTSDGWILDPGCQMVVDFKQEFGIADKREFRVEGVVWVDGREHVDLALIKLEASAVESGQSPAPLRLQKDEGYANKGNNVYVVGYPAADPKRNDPKEMQRIFAGVYEKKRLAPGRISSLDPTEGHLSHDCSTLGGNSGSCVVDLSTNSVIGLHFEGDYLVANKAILLPSLASDPKLSGLNWQAGRDA
jgi:V8-like Glu-specific endopeptidase